MAKHLRKTTLVVGAVLALTATTTAAHGLAHTAVTVSGNTAAVDVSFTGDNTSSIEFETDWAVPTWCNDVDLDGRIFQGKPVEVGETIGTIDSLSMRDCFMVSNLPIEIDASPGAHLEVASHPANPGDPIDIVIKGVDMHYHNTGAPPWACEFAMTGEFVGTLDPGDANADGYLTIYPSNFSLNITALDGTGSPSGSGLTCLSQIGTGDVANMNGAFEFDTNGAGAIRHG